jgi:protease IV
MPIEINSQNTNQQTPQVIEIKPKLGGFLWSYIIFSLPGFLGGLVWLLIAFVVLIGTLAGVAGASNSKSDFNSDTKLNYESVSGFENSNKLDSTNQILIYDLSGAITYDSNLDPSMDGINVKKVKKDFENIKKDTTIKNVVFKLNTPGGEVFASEILGDLIKDLVQTKTPNQLGIFYFDQIVASGGLLATYKNPNYVIASPYGETGSIGVILHVPNYKSLADKVGYSETVIKSAASKDIGNPLRDISESEKSYLQEQVDTQYSRFKNIVGIGRKLDSIKVDGLATGLVWFNSDAKTKGLVDEIGDISSAVQMAAKNINLENYKVVETKKDSNFFKSIFSSETILQNFGLVNQINKQFNFKSGLVYAIDDTRI